MNFGNPDILWLLLVFPPGLVLFFWWSARKKRMLMSQFIPDRLLPSLTVGLSPFRRKARMSFIVLAVIALLVAIARPQWGFDWEDVKVRGLDIIVAIDTSKSMLAEDIPPNRLARAKLAALDLMQQARADRLGLVAFAGTAFLECPLTIDDSAFRQSVEALDVNIIPQGGTALAEAIETAEKSFKEGDSYKAVVLFSDGEDQDSGAVEAAKKAAQGGMQIFTIGIGSAEGELLRITDAKGRTDYIRDEQGNVVKSRLNQDLLREIASATSKGFYLPLQGAKTIDTLYAQGLGLLPKGESTERRIRRYHERYHWPLAVAIAFLIAEMLLPERRRQPRARRAQREALPAMTPATAVLIAFLLFPCRGLGSPSSALREFNSGKYDEAQKEYERLLQRQGDDSRLHFNAGAAAYRNGKFDAALKQFEEALKSPDLKMQQRAYYNRGNTLFHLGETVPDPEKRKEAWQNALKDFQSTVRLDSKDADAKFNYDYVKQKLEELKQQQQQSQQNKSDKNQNQDQNKDQNQQNQGQQQNQDQQAKSQSGQDQSNQDQSKQKQDEQAKKDQQGKQDLASNDKSAQNKDDKPGGEKQKDQSAQAANQEGQDKQKEREQDENGKPLAPGQMSPREAQQLLDAQKGDEKLLPVKPQARADRNRPLRDW